MFNMIEELFNPGRKHAHDEKKRLELSRTDVADADPGRGPIDLDSGKVLIRPADTPEPGGAPELGGASEPGGADGGEEP
ncbi:DUF6191 domain-containing protein [Streptomyces sp. W1SF4]|uniref:DUF6191 domain-containing protein n=1 Tax=Streptomyces sp. W1SF4 TaxID=2305220 RepID=UPI000F703A1F|nr:DUF6191 domain-containing protein [Streptomyces sp. W1SF4]AZM91323.1 hypothetical protein D1J60_24975 [Streptomyces sp. W1SF4]